MSLSPLLAQVDTTGKKTDSLNILILKNYNEKLAKIDGQRKEDSITKADLMTKLNS